MSRTSPASKPAVVNRDFFAFCTSLKPIELRALGLLSQVLHLGADETIYRAGDPSETMYIVNRGVVEITLAGSPSLARGSYLSRGDIFGDVGVLTGLPRKNPARAREQVSLRCFKRDDFAELVRRVPSFFHYLSEQLANRLLQARDAALSPSHCLELSGSLANFDLVTIYQTIVNSAQTGELSILDEKGEMLSAFYFEGGQPRGGQFQHLTGEEAFWQLFLTDELRGTFAFTSGPRRISQTIHAPDFVRNPDEMLINAVQGRDELRASREEIPDPSALLLRLRSDLAVGTIAPRLRSLAETIWPLSQSGSIALCDIYSRSEICELKIYQAVQELVRTGHFALSPAVAARKVPNECKA